MARYEVRCKNPGLARTIYHRLNPKYEANNTPGLILTKLK